MSQAPSPSSQKAVIDDDNSVRLSFGSVSPIFHQIYEVIVDEGIEMDLEMVEEYHSHLETLGEHSIALLIDKKHKYTYTFGAQQQIGNVERIKAMAVVAHHRSTVEATKTLMQVPRDYEFNVKIFSTRDPALDWLKSELEPTLSN